MRILVYEYLSAGARADSAAALSQEGWGMLDALVRDLAGCPGIEAHTLLAPALLPEAAGWPTAVCVHTAPPGAEVEPDAETLDSHGTPLASGDSVTLIKDLDVKGAGFVAKRGTLVKNIRLTGDPAHVEGKVNGVAIVLKTQFLKKA